MAKLGLVPSIVLALAARGLNWLFVFGSRIRALCDFLSERFQSSLTLELPQDVIKRVKRDLNSGKYTGCIKLDVSDFYPSIKHSELKSRLKKRIKEDCVLGLIESAVSTPTVAISRPSDPLNKRGIPQGLAISNVLAAIYLINIDRYLKKKSGIAYYRYVDDVLIFCDLSQAEEIARDVIKRFKQIGLKIHDPVKVPAKSSIGPLSRSFDYLGYQFDNSLVSARLPTVEKLKESLVAIFTSYSHSRKKDQDFLLWRLNLRITGCIFENKSKGWLFFFSEINHESLLHVLDHYVQKLCKRFGVSVKPKRFVRAFYQIQHRRYETQYIPNFDDFDLAQKTAVLTKYFKVDIKKLSNDEIEYEFHKRVGKQVKDLLVDIKDFKY